MDAPIDTLLPPPLADAPRAKKRWWTHVLHALGGAAVGGVATALVLRGVDTSGLDTLPALALVAVAAALSGWLHTLLHEAGHAIAGVVVGLKPLAFGVGPLRAERGERGWHLRWGGSVGGIGGFALLLPPVDASPKASAQALYLLGGPLANLLVAGLALPLVLALDGPVWAEIALGMFVVIGVVIGIINLVPFRSGGWLSDGAHLRRLRTDPDAVMAGLRMQQLVRASVDGVRPRDWPAALLPRGPLPTLPTDSPMAMPTVVLRLSHAIDTGDADSAEACARFLAAYWPHSQLPERPGIALTMAAYAAIIRPGDALLLAPWRALASRGLLDQTAHEAWLDAELAQREGRLDDARRLLDESRAALPRIHDSGTRVTVAERLEVLADRLAGV